MLENALLNYLKSIDEISEATDSNKQIKYNTIVQEISKLLDKKIVHNEDIENQESPTFILSILSHLPFTRSNTNQGQASVEVIEYKTDQLPEMHYRGTKEFLNDVIAGTYDPKKITSTIKEESKRRTLLRARQGLRIMEFLDDEYAINDVQITEYKRAKNKNIFLQNLVLSSPYISMIFDLLKHLNPYSRREKVQIIKDLGMRIVKNSRGDNWMLESVADYRTRNIVSWLQGLELVDEELNPIMKEKIRPLLQKVLDEYLTAKQEPFGGNPMGSLVRNDLVSAIGDLDYVPNDRYLIEGSVGKGNWANVPWLSIMNKMITTSTQRGYYIVYLFSEDMERLYLTIAQGVTESSKEEMLKIKGEIRDHIHMDQDISTDNEIKLGRSKRAKDYEVSVAAYITYNKVLPSEETLQKDLARMIKYYEEYIEFNRQKVDVVKEEEIIDEAETGMTLTLKETVNHVHRYIQGKGFYFEKEEVTNFILSLKTKPFVILSGISGTGKTKIVQWLAEAIGATEDNGQFTLIPVRPDWNDGSDLLGYTDIKGEFKEGPLTKVVKRALNNPTKPYIVLLDEMNLARVEYYFSDILSVMESRDWKDGEILSSYLLTEETAGENLVLPSNIYIVGTVNMDETTHPFSKKVLDRANTIEFNRVELGHLDFLYEVMEEEPMALNQEVLEAKYLHLKDVFTEQPDLVRTVTEELVNINEVLELIHAHVGYRVRDEICMYITYNEQEELMTINQAFDHCLLQKILPRIAGSDSRLSEVLDRLIEICAFEIPEDTQSTVDLSYAKYPKSAEKLLEMRRRLVDGFTSFWIS